MQTKDIIVKRLKGLNQDKNAVSEALLKTKNPQEIQYLENQYQNIVEEVQRQLDYSSRLEKSNPTRLVLPDDQPHESRNSSLIRLFPSVDNDTRSRKKSI